MGRSSTRWILAFNASCRTCRTISESVAQACDGKLEVLPLTDSMVEQWRKQALGPQAPWAPTLLRISDQDAEAHAWTGPAMGLRLVLLLGLQSTLHVLAALEGVRRGEKAPLSRQTGQGAIGRAQFLRLCAGGSIAAGLILIGKTPAFAAEENKAWAEAHTWVEAHKDHLPTNYDDLIAYPLVYRKAIYRASTPEIRARFWHEQLTRYRTAHPECSAKQRAVLDHALKLTRTDLTTLTKADEQAMIAAFGKDEARAIFATLGPEPTILSARIPDYSCECSNSSPNCSGDKICKLGAGGCTETGGCGAFWSYPCNGMCQEPS